MKLRCAYRVGIVRKKPTNLTISQSIRDRGSRIMALQGFTSFSVFVEHLIREEYDRRFNPLPTSRAEEIRETNSASGLAAAHQALDAGVAAAHASTTARPLPAKPTKYKVARSSKKKPTP